MAQCAVCDKTITDGLFLCPDCKGITLTDSSGTNKTIAVREEISLKKRAVISNGKQKLTAPGLVPFKVTAQIGGSRKRRNAASDPLQEHSK